MRFIGFGALALLGISSSVLASPASPTSLRRFDDLVVMTPSPTQDAPPGLRLRTMVRPDDHLWIGPDLPAFVSPTQGTLHLALLDPTPSGGWVATYREGFDSCEQRGDHANCKATVVMYSREGVERHRVALNGYLSRRDHLEVQDVRWVEGSDGKGTLLFNEACQSYSRDARGACSSLVALDLDGGTPRVRWRTPALISNNWFQPQGDYVVAAYGFTGEPAFVSIVRQADGKVMSRQRLRGTNYEMRVVGDTLSIEMYRNIGRADYAVAGFRGATPTLRLLRVVPPDPTERPKPYDPPLVPKPNGTRARDPFGLR
jgi:hypothetical protein